MISGKNILITGTNGFLGKNICNELAKNNKLFVIERHEPDFDCEFYEIDLSKPLDSSILPKKIDLIIHMAAELDANSRSVSEVFNINTSTTLSLLEYAKANNIKKFVYFSSGSIYGDTSKPQSEEDAIPLTKLDYYSYTKAISDALVQRYSQFFTTIILRPYYVYGKGQAKTRWIHRIINNIKTNQPVTLINKGLNPRLSLIYIKDFVKAFLKAVELKDSSIMNFTSNENLSIKEIAEIIGSKLNKVPKFVQKEDKNVKNRIANISRMIKLLKFEPKTKFKDAVSEIL